jgi:hypothetical protein
MNLRRKNRPTLLANEQWREAKPNLSSQLND